MKTPRAAPVASVQRKDKVRPVRPSEKRYGPVTTILSVFIASVNQGWSSRT